MTDVTVNVQGFRLPPCPRCHGQLTYVYNPILSFLRIIEPYYKCPFCDWKKTKRQVQKDGGLYPAKQFHQDGGHWKQNQSGRRKYGGRHGYRKRRRFHK